MKHTEQRQLVVALEHALSLATPAARRLAVTAIQSRLGIELEAEGPGCRYLAQPLRLLLWGQPVEPWQRLGWTCEMRYCGNPACMTLEPDATYGQRSYHEIRQRLRALADGEHFDLPNEPADPKSVLKFRTGLLLSKDCPHFLLRTLPTGGVRVIRTGDFYEDRAEQLRRYPILIEPRRQKSSER